MKWLVFKTSFISYFSETSVFEKDAPISPTFKNKLKPKFSSEISHADGMLTVLPQKPIHIP